jgi:hypothetical protein
MFHQLFRRSCAVRRHCAGPFLEERLCYLAYLADLTAFIRITNTRSGLPFRLDHKMGRRAILAELSMSNYHQHGPLRASPDGRSSAACRRTAALTCLCRKLRRNIPHDLAQLASVDVVEEAVELEVLRHPRA